MRQLSLGIILFTSFLFVSCKDRGIADNFPEVKNGAMDLGDWSFDRDGSLNLNGEWRVYWNKLLLPHELGDFHSGELVHIPSYWSMPKNLEKDKGFFTKNHGYATFAMVVNNIRAQSNPLALDIKSIGTSCRLFVTPLEDPSRNLLSINRGNVSTEREAAIADLRSALPSFLTLGNTSLLIVVQVSNYHHNYGGIWYPIKLGKERQLLKEKYSSQTIDACLLSMIFIIMVYNLSLFIQRREDRGTLYLALFCFSVILRGMMTSRFFADLIGIGENWVYEFRQGVEYITMLLIALFFMFFCNVYFTRFFNQKVVKLITWVMVFLAIFPVLLPGMYYTPFLVVFQIAIMCSGVYTAQCYLKAAINNAIGARIGVSGVFVLLFAAFYDILVARNILPPPYIEYFGTVVFIILQSLIVGKRFSRAFRLSQKLSNDLQLEVERQTRDIKAILKNIKQGIFTISNPAKMVVSKDYSQFLEEILEDSNVSDKTVDNILLKKCAIGEDVRSQINSVLNVSIGEKSVSYKMNAHVLPKELIYRTPVGKEKIIEVDWSPIVNQERAVEKILVCIRDVTKNRKLEEETKRNQRELKIIDEILSVNEESFERFVALSKEFFRQNRDLIEKNSSFDDEVIKVMFINMHTLKGMARILGFKDMAEVLHNLEQKFSDVQNMKYAWNQREMFQSQSAVEVVFDEYNALNQEKLGRGKHLGEVRLKLKTVKRTLDLMSFCASEKKNYPHYDELFSTYKDLYYMDIKIVFDEIMKGLAVLAKDLKKEMPSVEVVGESLSIDREGANVLRNMFIHILRNSMDHGIETPEERSKLGKSKSGNILLSLKLESNALSIGYADDGRGLDLNRIRSLGIERKYISKDDSLSKNEIAGLILESGLSTSCNITQISGRGIGLGAVRSYIEEVGGGLDIELDSKNEKNGYTPFSLTISLPLKYICRNSY